MGGYMSIIDIYLNDLCGKLGNQIAITDALGNSVTFQYEALGHLTSAIDANGNATSFAYDALDRLISITDPLGAC